MQELRLSWLRTFVSVYRRGSFTRAARELGLSQPAVTQQIRGLEKKLGRPLFERLPEGVRPTETAETLMRDVQAPIDALGAVVDRLVACPKSMSSRPVRLGGPNELLTTRVLPALGELVQQGLQLRLGFGPSEELLQELADGRYDLVLTTRRPRARAFSAHPLFDEEYVLLASRRLRDEIPVDRLPEEGPAVLEKYPVVAYAESLPYLRCYWRSVFEDVPGTVPAVVVPDLRGVLAAVRASAGISVLPTYLCREELVRGEVVPLLEPEVPPINTVYLTTRAGGLPQPHVQLVHGVLLLQAQMWG
ncbi:LysR family transcriptional regulator [Streptoverticillium reticulum]|uniref:LysR family transcriptional regulator n=1 Tax=Streptoverticillium reticulum TaxID=1433415 RepID=UPI0039BF277B